MSYMDIKPIRKSDTLPLISQVEGFSPSRFAVDALLSAPRIVSEGSIESDAGGEPRFVGATMITIELDDSRFAAISLPVERERLRIALTRSIAMHVKLMRLAREEAERMSAPSLPRGMRTELEFTIEGSSLLVDIEIECPLAEPEPFVVDASEEGL